MDDHEAHDPDTQIKDAIWTYGGWFVLLTLTLGAGIALGYSFWGDAVLLRASNNEMHQQLLAARSDRENFSLKLVNAQEELGRCQRKLAAAPAAPAAAPQ